MIKLKLVFDKDAELYPDHKMRDKAYELIRFAKNETAVTHKFEQLLFITAIMVVLKETAMLTPEEVVFEMYDESNDKMVEEYLDEDYRLRHTKFKDVFTEFRKILMGF